jgi:hypothetical protein
MLDNSCKHSPHKLKIEIYDSYFSSFILSVEECKKNRKFLKKWI